MYDEGIKDNKTRRLIFQYISDNPGISFPFLKDAFKLNEGTLRYHLDYLLRKDRIVLEKNNGKRCYFTSIKKRFPYSDKGLKLNDNQRILLEIISNNPGISFGRLGRLSGMESGPFAYNLNKLKTLKLIWKTKKGEGFGYELLTKEKISDEIILILLNKFMDGEVEEDSLMEMFDKLEEYRKS